jgi:hypothetical protein
MVVIPEDGVDIDAIHRKWPPQRGLFRKQRRSGWCAVAVLVCMIAALSIGTYVSWHDCKTAGGTTVRGLIWWECAVTL